MFFFGLLTLMFVACYGGVWSIYMISDRTSDYTAAMALAEAKISDIRATDYPGTNGVFLSTGPTTNINTVTVDLNKAGTTLLVPGTVTSVCQPISWGHLVTVTVVIQEPNTNHNLTTTMQTVVNQFSGGRGQ